MKHSVVQHLLALLVVWTFTNDAWAAVTPEPADDAAAAEDNVYLSVSQDWSSAARVDQNTPLTSATPFEQSQPSYPVSAYHVAADQPDACSLIYRLMTLRR